MMIISGLLESTYPSGLPISVDVTFSLR